MLQLISIKTSLIAVLALVPCVVFAVDTTSPTATPLTPSTAAAHAPALDRNQELAVMTEKLKLSPEQQDEIKPILVAEADKRKSILADTMLTPQEKHQQAFSAHRQSLQQIKAFFTPEQMAQINQGMNHSVPSPTTH